MRRIFCALALLCVVGPRVASAQQTIVAVDAPVANSTVQQPFLIGGWAIRLASPSGPGVKHGAHLGATARWQTGVPARGANHNPRQARRRAPSVRVAVHGFRLQLLGTGSVAQHVHRSRSIPSARW